MSDLVENVNRVASCIIQEAPGFHSRDQITIEGGSGVVANNSVLGMVTASKNFAPLDPDADDGSEVAAAILFAAVDATSAAARATGLVRSLDVQGAALVWPAAMTDEQKLAAQGQLASKFIIVR